MLAAVIVPVSAAQADNSSTGCLTASSISEVLSGAKDFINNAVESAKGIFGKESPVIGDADGDGVVSIIDATFIQRILAGLSKCPVIKALLDVDGDGELTILDVTTIQRWLVGLICPDRPEEPTEEPTAEPTEAPSNVDFASMKKLSEIIAVSGNGSRASTSQLISYIFKYNGKLYRAKAANTDDITARIDALDYTAEDYEAQILAVLGDAEIISVDDISDSIPTQEEMNALVGKTGQELLDMGFTIENCDASEEGVSCSAEKGYAAYLITCDGKVEYYEGIDAEALFKTMKVTKVEYNGESMAAYDLPEEE